MLVVWKVGFRLPRLPKVRSVALRRQLTLHGHTQTPTLEVISLAYFPHEQSNVKRQHTPQSQRFMGLDVTCGRRQDTHTSPALRRAEETIRPPLRWVGRGGARLVEETEHLTASVLSLRLFVVHDAV